MLDSHQKDEFVYYSESNMSVENDYDGEVSVDNEKDDKIKNKVVIDNKSSKRKKKKI